MILSLGSLVCVILMILAIYSPNIFDCGFYFILKNSVSFPTGQTITPTGMAIMPSSHLYGHTGLLHSAMPILTTATNTTGGHLITAGVAPTHPGYTAGNNLCVLFVIVQLKLCKYDTQTLIISCSFLSHMVTMLLSVYVCICICVWLKFLETINKYLSVITRLTQYVHILLI